MKTYLAAGIGDMISLDSLLTKKEKENITEFYWACRWGKTLLPLFLDNKAYPNLKRHHIIEDEIGKEYMFRLDPTAVLFWHFRPDFHPNYEVGLSLFKLSKEEVNPIDTIAILTDFSRKYQGSSFLENAKKESTDWDFVKTVPNGYILVHYPTSSRPRGDIAQITEEDWRFIEDLSKNKDLDVVVISDTEINPLISRGTVLVNYNIKSIVALCKFAEYFVGCDSFVSVLCSKVLHSDRMYIKGHDFRKTHGKHISEVIRERGCIYQNHFTPHSTEDIVSFFTSELCLKPGDMK